LHALDLFRIAAEDDARRMAAGKMEQFPHLTARDHPSLIYNQNLSMKRAMRPLILQQPLDCERIAEADVLQFFNRAHRRSNGENLAIRFPERPMQFSQHRRLSRSSSPADVYGSVR